MRKEVKEIIEMFLQKPPEYSLIGGRLNSCNLSKAELTEIAGAILDYSESDEYESICTGIINETDDNSIIGNLYSNYIYYSIKLLFDYGLDPNSCQTAESGSLALLFMATCIADPYEGPKTVKLFLQNGADPNISCTVDSQDVTVFEGIDFEIYFHELSNLRYYSMFQIWLLMIAYGGKRKGEIPVKFIDRTNDVSVFKDFERFTYKYEIAPSDSGNSTEQYIYIIDKSTGKIIAYS